MELVYVCVVLALLLSITSVSMLVVYIKKYNKLQNLYEKTLAKFNNSSNIKETFDGFYERLAKTEFFCNETEAKVIQLKEQLNNSLQKVGIVKYNAMDDTDNKLSFVLALLDEKNTGMVLNSIYSKHGNVTYCKVVENGTMDGRYTDEELEAIESAKIDKEYLPRKEITKNKEYKREMRKKS